MLYNFVDCSAGKTKFDIQDEVKFVLNKCGTEIDEDYFTTLISGDVILVLQSGEMWTKGTDIFVRGVTIY
jgi:hypothetical protein